MGRVRESLRVPERSDADHAEPRVEPPTLQFARRPGAVTPRTAPADPPPKDPSGRPPAEAPRHPYNPAMAEPTPQQRIESDLKTAMKAGRKDQVGTLRMLLAELKNERIRRGDDVDEPGFIAIVRKMIKQRDDSAAQYDKGNRPELAAKEREEAAYLQEEYLPKGPSEDEIRRAVEELRRSATTSPA